MLGRVVALCRASLRRTILRQVTSRQVISRCATALLVSILPAVGTPATTAAAADKLTVRLEWSTYVMHLPLHLAAEKGWFKAADLDVDIEDGNGSVTTVQLVGNGRFELGHASLSAMAVGAARGLPVTSLSEYLKKSPLGVIYAKDLGIKSLQDLVGKKIIYTPGSFESPFLEPFFTQNGIPIGKLNLVGVDASAKISSYATGNADAFVTTVPGDMPHVEDKRPSESMLFADYGMSLPTFGLITNAEALKTKGPAVKRFASVVSAAWAYIFDGHAQEAAEAAMKQRPNAPTSVARLVAEFKRHEPFFVAKGNATYPGLQDRSDWAKAIREMETAKVIPTGTAPEKYFTNDYIDPDFGKKITSAAK